MKRANFLGAPEAFLLNQACMPIVAAFGPHLYLVGSCLTRRDYRDVDLRMILPNDEFDRLFPGAHGCNYALSALWSVLCSAISLQLSRQSGLPIDFQIQRMTEANREEPDGQRCAIGMFVRPAPPPSPVSGSGDNQQHHNEE